jgi:gas vesicle structural protein
VRMPGLPIVIVPTLGLCAFAAFSAVNEHPRQTTCRRRTGEERPVTTTQRARSEVSFIDVLDRVLDKGVVIDGWARISLVGIDLMTIDGWVFVASIQTYLQYADSLGLSPRVPTGELRPASLA